MKEQLKAYCEYEYKNVVEHSWNPNEAITRCYGAVMCFINFIKPEDDNEMGAWWDDEMLPRFRKILLDK